MYNKGWESNLYKDKKTKKLQKHYIYNKQWRNKNEGVKYDFEDTKREGGNQKCRHFGMCLKLNNLSASNK